MIKKLNQKDLIVSEEIREVFQASYAIEATLLDAINFPPLQRKLENFVTSHNDFFGYMINKKIAGVIEIRKEMDFIHVQSLVVHPSYFRQGIGKNLMEFVFKFYESNLFMVETGLDNGPATKLYKTLGYKEVKQWNTEIGIRKIRFEKQKD